MKINILGAWLISGILAFLSLSSCKNDGFAVPLENSTVPPGMITNVNIENRKGGAIITYALPDDQDLLYVKANYVLQNGNKMEAKASYYNNSLTIEGYSDTLEHNVTLYAVNRSEVASDSVVVKIKPLRSSIWDVFKSLKATAAFGGVRIDALNSERSDVAILIMEKDQYGEWQISPNSIYTSTDTIGYTYRGLDTNEHKFAITIRDRWLNYTDTLFTDIKPLYETAIPKSQYSGIHLPGDAPWNTKTTMDGMWDGDILNWPKVYQTQAADLNPAMITINIGSKVKLSRVVIWDYPEYYNGRTYYYLGNLKDFEIYGWPSSTPPTDASLDNWVLLGHYHATKPSGLPFGEQNDEDYQTAYNGFNWDIDISAPKVQYIRIRSIKNWGGTTYMGIAELQVYGDPR
ncbi:DUF4959 domain-containing protein [Arachidicoccus ginsenosidivorans]|uniref:DUF4959 domain-containing protein n=1 Tax=Arachidicoccus ginsenosidivorans TaxID=496057 RepID=A0A5B8VMD1_9BACT|nr:DUF4959 domain-containing protein [Arachidicoccus ginsenosidivorans]QEC72112.1 DUF4959 domain-containing protein [Arachidicoccus ginsenosidivorans]